MRFERVTTGLTDCLRKIPLVGVEYLHDPLHLFSFLGGNKHSRNKSLQSQEAVSLWSEGDAEVIKDTFPLFWPFCPVINGMIQCFQDSMLFRTAMHHVFIKPCATQGHQQKHSLFIRLGFF